MDLGCNLIKLGKKTEKYSPLFAAPKRYWGRVDFIAFPIGHADTTRARTLDQLTAACFTDRPTVDRSRANRGAVDPTTDHNAMTHDYNPFKSLMDSLTDLAMSRLIGIIRNQNRLVDALPGGIRHRRANGNASPTHHHGAHQQGAATHTHRTRTTRALESTAIT
jgi:hypothetical protein